MYADAVAKVSKSVFPLFFCRKGKGAAREAGDGR